jgi:hypothetical protein
MYGPAWLDCSLHPSSNSAQAGWGVQADPSPLTPMDDQLWSEPSRPLSPGFPSSVLGSAVTAASSGVCINNAGAHTQDLADARPIATTYVLPNPPLRRVVQRQSVAVRSVPSQAEPVSFSFSGDGKSAWLGGLISPSVRSSEISYDLPCLSTDLEQPDWEPNTNLDYTVRREEANTQDHNLRNWYGQYPASFDLDSGFKPHSASAWHGESQGREPQDKDSFAQVSVERTAVANQPPTVPQPVGGALRPGAAAARYNALHGATKARIPRSPGTSRQVVWTTSSCGRAYYSPQQLHPALAPAPTRPSGATSESLFTPRPVGLQNSIGSSGKMSSPEPICLRDELARLQVTYDLARRELSEADNYRSQMQDAMNEMYTLIHQCNAGSLREFEKTRAIVTYPRYTYCTERLSHCCTPAFTPHTRA